MNNGTKARNLGLLALAMFGFGFALVPLYDVFCDITGLNGKTDSTAAVAAQSVNEQRSVTVEFVTYQSAGLRGEFMPSVQRLSVHPGEMHRVDFTVTNPGISSQVLRAIPSVSPGRAAGYLRKTECFCFQEQPLDGQAQAVMPMTFYVDEALPADIEVFTLSYTLYDISEQAAGQG
ncbi:cytochrome c oxidase assembly protein [Oceanimonas baumannii]|uniref:Cytochrome c oxidase assembly protein CtaG n=1 Tax=Oceanimonas baumannii TaxID=129578 RepID=A0A235CG20_9GAMM|nr:cytochrome c oxidase assembly protein [Oceanimonas baumannii]OYD23551.1 cytochrome c oxidase assembly protein [Oceanimonas baumannii]TDW56913.1 cytochrome c oxidase assembly protein subunit 11 [Oceanimonas baumannii]